MNRPIALLAAASLAGCFSTEHVGRDRRKVYATMENSVRGYTRDGVFHSEMGFGGGLVEAVEGNPRATEAAETFRDRMILGFVSMLGGFVCLPTLALYDVARASDSESNWSPPISHGYIAVGCVALGLIGAFTVGSAQPYMLDAINIYNDDVDAQSSPMPQWPPTQFPPQPPMQPPPSQSTTAPGTF